MDKQIEENRLLRLQYLVTIAEEFEKIAAKRGYRVRVMQSYDFKHLVTIEESVRLKIEKDLIYMLEAMRATYPSLAQFKEMAKVAPFST